MLDFAPKWWVFKLLPQAQYARITGVTTIETEPLNSAIHNK